MSDSLYRRLLGDALDDAPAPVRAIHDSASPRIWAGTCRIRRGNALAQIVCTALGLPSSGENVPVTVTMEPHDGGERWTRLFGTQTFRSNQYESADGRLLVERVGPVSFAMQLTVAEDRLRLDAVGWRFLGLPMPRALLPGGENYETAEDGRFLFNVDIRAPLVGPIIAYRGLLSPV